MKSLFPFLIYAALLVVCTDCSKKEAEIPPTPELLESRIWQMTRQTYIQNGKDFEPNPLDYTPLPALTSCDKALLWTFIKGTTNIDFSANACRTGSTDKGIYNKAAYSMANGVLTIRLVGYQPETWQVSFSGNDMAWSTVSGNGRRYYFTKK